MDVFFIKLFSLMASKFITNSINLLMKCMKIIQINLKNLKGCFMNGTIIKRTFNKISSLLQERKVYLV